jgi:hypothetical protein
MQLGPGKVASAIIAATWWANQNRLAGAPRRAASGDRGEKRGFEQRHHPIGHRFEPFARVIAVFEKAVQQGAARGSNSARSFAAQEKAADR